MDSYIRPFGTTFCLLKILVKTVKISSLLRKDYDWNHWFRIVLSFYLSPLSVWNLLGQVSTVPWCRSVAPIQWIRWIRVKYIVVSIIYHALLKFDHTFVLLAIMITYVYFIDSFWYRFFFCKYMFVYIYVSQVYSLFNTHH